MKIAFFSNFLNHHQLPLCMEFIACDDIEFTFVATQPIPQERLNMNYEDMNEKYSFVLCSYKDENAYLKAMDLAIEADVVIFGDAPAEFFEKRMLENKITFKYCERLFKKGTYRRFVPFIREKIKNRYIKYKDKELYILGASAYTSYDLTLCGFDKEKCFKWGYFPKVKTQDIDDIIKNKKENSILWAGRFLDWKHPELAIYVAEKLKKKEVLFHLDMIGTGEELPRIERLIREKNLDNEITLHGSMPPEEVRFYMEKSSIFLFTSDFYEGWGAVLNEAMNSGCACVASHAIGSSPYLITDKKNGLIYKNGDKRDLFTKTVTLLDDHTYAAELGVKAYNTLLNEWSADVAARRFLQLSKSLQQDGKSELFKSGPCSRAKVLTNKWYKK